MFFVGVLFLVTHIFTACVARGPPRHTGKVHYRQISKVGQSKKLLCPVEADPAPLMQWIKDGHAIHSGWQRFRIVQDGALRIKEVQIEDAGRYVCKATNGFGSINVNYSLIVIDESSGMVKQDNNLYPQTPDEDLTKEGAPPNFFQPQKMKRNEINRPVGSSVRLKCRSSGNPRPHLTWVKGVHVLADEREDGQQHKPRWTLKLNNLKENDSGQYTCIVSNRLGSINFTYNLEVIEKIKTKPVLLPPHPLNTTVEYGGIASFQCRVQSVVQPHIQWLKRVEHDNLQPDLNTTIMVKGQKFVVLKTGEVWNRPDGSYLNKLIINRATDADSGMYICLGANSMGYNFRSAFLTVLPGPRVRSNYQTTESNNTNLFLIIAVPASVVVVIVLFAVFLIQRRKQYNNASRTTKNSNSRFNPVPTQEKDPYPAVHNPNILQNSREKITKNHSIDFYSDISSVSRSHHNHQHMPQQQYGY
ncbi:hypothetical protein ScPMuIL_000521 [Solemya velum]